MNPLPDNLQDLIDDYLAGLLDEAGVARLEQWLRADGDARRHFARYARLNTDLHLEMKAQVAGERALEALTPDAPPARSRSWRLALLAVAAALLAAVGFGAWLGFGRPDAPREEIAWLVNAQDCQWAGQQAPAGDMRVGKVLQLDRGLAEISFQSGVRVVLEGPASLELTSTNSARLLRGKLTAKVPEAARGFQITLPQGKVVDLGTEFGVAVDRNGASNVYVFAGKVEAYAGQAAPVSLKEKQAARIDATGVAVKPGEPVAEAKQFVREIVPVPTPRTVALDFKSAIPDSIAGAGGSGTGLTHRLPGTGGKLPNPDPNLRLDPALGQLVLKTTNSDLNTSFRVHVGEYLGVRLTDLGFAGAEDFTISVVMTDIPALPRVGQFGLYVGVHHKLNFRGGVINWNKDAAEAEYGHFVMQNKDGKDRDFRTITANSNTQGTIEGKDGKDVLHQIVGAALPGHDLRITLRREGSKYTLTNENLTTGVAMSLTVPQPDFLAGQNDLYVGVFGANTQSDQRRDLTLKEFKVKVWPVPPTAP
jgi:hypothetical protein